MRGSGSRAPNRSAIGRCPSPPTCASIATPITSTSSWRRTRHRSASSTCVPWQPRHRARRGRHRQSPENRDHSRLLVGWRWGTGEDVFRFEAALRSGLMSRGVPMAILVDRGSPFVSSQLLRACAVLGVRLVHAAPRAATTKGKIERFFRTVRDRFLVEIDDGVELVELNRLFSAWLEVVYHRRTHTETGVSLLRPVRRRGRAAVADPGLVAGGVSWSQEPFPAAGRLAVGHRRGRLPARGRAALGPDEPGRPDGNSG